MIELRIQGGARAGERVRVDGDVVMIGRHPSAQVQLDAKRDLEVSSRHAELRKRGGEWFISDLESTNGTFMHGVKVEGEWAIQDGDVITLGARGLSIEIRTADDVLAEPLPTVMQRSPVDPMIAVETHAHEIPQDEPPKKPHRPTAERIAIAVQEETAKLKRVLLAAGIVLVAGIGVAYWIGHRESSRQLAELRALLEENDQTSSLLRARMAGVADTSTISAIGRAADAVRAKLRSGKIDEGEAAKLRAEIERSHNAQRSLATIDIPAVNARNAPATAFLVAELKGKAYAGTAFAIAPNGLMVTNRHLVRTEDGSSATRLAIKFRDSREWLAAKIVKVAEGADDDLALIQLETPRTVPVVAGIASADAVAEGAPVVLVGYPLGTDARMEGTGEDFIAKSTLFPGTVSKTLTTVTQIAAWAGHGSSGSPVLDASGRVIGVVWGGPRDSNGQLVYAVPASRLAAFVSAQAPGIVR